MSKSTNTRKYEQKVTLLILLYNEAKTKQLHILPRLTFLLVRCSEQLVKYSQFDKLTTEEKLDLESLYNEVYNILEGR